MAESVHSKNGVSIRLTDERWTHITEEDGELAGLRLEIMETVANPAEIFAGNQGELLAVREVEPGKYLVVVYRESQHDGFIITTFLTRRRHTASKVTTMAALAIEEYLRLLPSLKQTGQGSLWMSYDAEADALYVNFKKPSYATDSELTDDDVIIRYEGEEVIGVTILHASQR